MEVSKAPSHLSVLVFEVDGHRYALETREVREIARAALPTRLPQAPDYVEGLINVRGEPACVFDLRARFALPRRAMQTSDALIVCRVRGQLAALHVDGVIDVCALPVAHLTQGEQVRAGATCLRGVLSLEDGLLFLCDLDEFLSQAEADNLERALASAVDGVPS